MFFHFNFDNSSSIYDEEFIASGFIFLSIAEINEYKPDPQQPQILINLTDYTSINRPIDNKCSIPFSLNQIDNYFCALDQNMPDSFQCQTENEEFKECELGCNTISILKSF